MLSGCLGADIDGNAIELAGFQGKADDDIPCPPPARSQGEDVDIAYELGIIPGLAVVMGA